MANSQNVTAYLFNLATTLVGEKRPLAAVKCLEAVLQHSPLPVFEAQARLQIALVLMDHMDPAFLPRAKDYLLKAEQLLGKVSEQLPLKCEVYATLAEAYQYLGQPQYQQAALQKGLKVSLADPAAPTSTTSPPATCFFLLRLAQATAVTDVGDALAAAEQGQLVAQQHGMLTDEFVFLLVQLQLHTAGWSRAAAEACLEALECLVGQLPGAADPNKVLQLQVQHRLLQAIYYLKLGRFVELHQDVQKPGEEGGGSNLLLLLEELLGQLKQECGNGCALAYDWLPLELLEALLSLLWAQVHKAGSNVADAKARISTGLGHVQQLLAAPAQHQHLHPGKQRQQVQLCLALRQLLWDCQFQVLMLATDYAAAHKVLHISMAALEAHPEALGNFAAQLHCRAGLYALAIQEFGFAHAHFEAAEQLGEPALMQPACQASKALALLAERGSSAAASAAEALGGGYQAVDPSLGYSERALQGLAAGAVLLHEGRTLDAKERLSQALKLVYKQLANNQLVAQVLNLMAPLQIGPQSNNDRAGARQMANTSASLCRGAGDLHTLKGTLHVMQQLLEQMNEGSSTTAQKNMNYSQKKQQELAGQLQTAGGDAEVQQQVLQWRLR